MRLLLLGDIFADPDRVRNLLRIIRGEKPDYLVLLGNVVGLELTSTIRDLHFQAQCTSAKYGYSHTAATELLHLGADYFSTNIETRSTDGIINYQTYEELMYYLAGDSVDQLKTQTLNQLHLFFKLIKEHHPQLNLIMLGGEHEVFPWQDYIPLNSLKPISAFPERRGFHMQIADVCHRYGAIYVFGHFIKRFNEDKIIFVGCEDLYKNRLVPARKLRGFDDQVNIMICNTPPSSGWENFPLAKPTERAWCLSRSADAIMQASGASILFHAHSDQGATNSYFFLGSDDSILGATQVGYHDGYILEL